MPDQTHAARRHPFPKAQYRVSNWHEYDQALQERGSLTLWVTPEAIAAWQAPPTGQRGRSPFDWRWCINPISDKLGACWVALADALRPWHPAWGHAVDHRTSDPCFALLGGESASAETRTDQGLITEHGCFHERSFTVTHRPLPASPPFLLDPVDVLVPQAGRCVYGRVRYSCRPWWDDDRRG